MMIGKLTHVSAEPDFQLRVSWDDGTSARIDLSKLLNERKVLAPLLAPEMFRLAVLSADAWSVEWPCGIDFGAPQLRRWAEQGTRAAA
jgi:hypothetical protein